MRYPVVRMGGLLEDYNRQAQAFRDKFDPGPVRPGFTPPPTTPNFILPEYPFPQSSVRTVPYQYPAPQPRVREFKPSAREFTFLSSDDLVGFCDIVMSFRRAPFASQERQDAVDAFSEILSRWPAENRNAVINEVESYCPWPDFFNSLTHPARSGKGTEPYVSPGRPVPSIDTRPTFVPVPPQAVTPPPVPSFDPLQRPRPVSQPGIYAPSAPVPTPSRAAPIPTTSQASPSLMPSPAPIPTQAAAPPAGSWGQIAQPSKAGWNQAPPDVATPGAGSNQCPPGQFWDGRQCRGAINLPGGLNIPGGLAPSGGAGGGVAFPNMGYRGYRIENL